MKFDSPAGGNPIDAQRVVGQPIDRIDGPLKVTGTATYAYEYHEVAPDAAYGVIVTAGIAHGRIDRIDTRDAERAPGVLLVLTHLNAPRQFGRDQKHDTTGDKSTAPSGGGGAKSGAAKSGGGGPPQGPGAHAAPQLQGPEIRQHGQAVALVVADSFERATAAAAMIRIGYANASGRYSLAAGRATAVRHPGAKDATIGDTDAAIAGAPVAIDVTYTTPNQAQSPMEPNATMAVWAGDAVTLYTAHQVMHWVTEGVADTLGMPRDKVRAISAFVGGGFGSKLEVYADAVLAVIAARRLGRPVKIALSRPQSYNHTSHRPPTIQRLRLAATRDGRLQAIGHTTWTGDQDGGRGEMATEQSRLMYAGANRDLQTWITPLDLPKGGSMRAPGEAVGLLALECAMDELAVALAIDPVELRIVNDTQLDPTVGASRPFSDRKLIECLRTGAQRFGWSWRKHEPGARRDGRWLIGTGMSAGIRNNVVMPSGTRVTLDAGRLLVETAMTDIGTGSYTIIAQTAAEMLGLPIAAVTVRLGDSALPRASGSGGSWGANSSTAGTYAACVLLREAITARAGLAADAAFVDGRVAAGGRSVALVALGGPPLTATDTMTYGDLDKAYAQASFAAHFCEVGVDRVSGEVRVRRMTSAYSAGRILNPKTARSQCLGGMTMGIGAALMEQLVVDERFGYFVNHDLAQYHVPVHADIPALEVVFVASLDDKSSPMKARGVGEVGICGVGAAVANAVHDACGVRVRDFPITLDKLLPGLARLA